MACVPALRVPDPRAPTCHVNGAKSADSSRHEGLRAAYAQNGSATKTTLRPTSRPTYVVGLPTSTCAGGTKLTTRASVAASSPHPPMTHTPTMPPGTR